MKNIFFLFLLSTSISLFSQNDSLYVDGMRWVTGRFEFDGEPEWINGVFTSVWSGKKVPKVFFNYKIDGDSVVNGIKYKKMILTASYAGNKMHEIYLFRYEDGKYLQYIPERMRHSSTTENEYILADIGDMNSRSNIMMFDTIFSDSPDVVRKYWKKRPYSDGSYDTGLEAVFGGVVWVEGIGNLSQPIADIINSVDCACYFILLCCINPQGDTIYTNRKYLDPMTNVSSIPDVEFSVRQVIGGCVVTLSESVGNWTAALYDSSGVTVATQYGSGDEIVLSTVSKGTHILTVNVGGEEYVRKILLK